MGLTTFEYKAINRRPKSDRPGEVGTIAFYLGVYEISQTGLVTSNEPPTNICTVHRLT